ncbi:hypothetical protein Vadar_000111 [Vaccinium darrowii]|uniref:Uncharacterized protein n=1 Tax=Vaccinium darrowii TaxID=229202 RepID=A0ACB7XE93_9ERIC|nr:hypothetical protein Vadar_000111 [Vaccinium darrowii]
MATTRILSRSLQTTKQTLSSLHSRSYTSAVVHLSTPPPSSLSSSLSLLRLRPLVAANFHSLSTETTTIRRYCTSTSASLNVPIPTWSNQPLDEKILPPGCDFDHWLVVMEKPEGDPTRDEIIDSYIKTLAQIVGSLSTPEEGLFWVLFDFAGKPKSSEKEFQSEGQLQLDQTMLAVWSRRRWREEVGSRGRTSCSEEEARRKIYSVSFGHYNAFGALVSEKSSTKIRGELNESALLMGRLWPVLPGDAILGFSETIFVCSAVYTYFNVTISRSISGCQTRWWLYSQEAGWIGLWSTMAGYVDFLSLKLNCFRKVFRTMPLALQAACSASASLRRSVVEKLDVCRFPWLSSFEVNLTTGSSEFRHFSLTQNKKIVVPRSIAGKANLDKADDQECGMLPVLSASSAYYSIAASFSLEAKKLALLYKDIFNSAVYISNFVAVSAISDSACRTMAGWSNYGIECTICRIGLSFLRHSPKFIRSISLEGLKPTPETHCETKQGGKSAARCPFLGLQNRIGRRK